MGFPLSNLLLNRKISHMNAKTLLFLVCLAFGLFNIFGVPFLFSKLGEKGTQEKMPRIVYIAVVGSGLLVIAAAIFFFLQAPKGFKSL